MRTIKSIPLFALLIAAPFTAFAQGESQETKQDVKEGVKEEVKQETKQETKTELKITGKPIVAVYANYSAGLGNANGQSGFNLDRSYLGYQFNFSKDLGGKVVFDVGSTKVAGSDLERVAYIKNAMLSWTPGNFTFNVGLIGLEQFGLQEKFWGYRYIWKSFQDEYKFNSSADMGIVAKYKFNKWLSADVTFINGEGYKKVNKDNNNRYGVGVTVTPIKPLTLRAYVDRYDADGAGKEAQQSMALFAGYKHQYFSLGLEYNKLWSSDFIKNQDKTGYSAYATVFINKKFAVYGRYDELTSKDHYFSGETRRAIAGVQYSPLRYLNFSPNIQTQNPSNGKASTYLFMNMEIKF